MNLLQRITSQINEAQTTDKKQRLVTSMNTILVFKNGELISQYSYKNKKDAIGNYRIFKKHGIGNPETGVWDKDVTVELI